MVVAFPLRNDDWTEAASGSQQLEMSDRLVKVERSAEASSKPMKQLESSSTKQETLTVVSKRGAEKNQRRERKKSLRER